jgi:hypothetical protein
MNTVPTILVCSAVLALSLLTACASSGPHLAPGHHPRELADSTLNAFHAAAANADFERYFANWSDQSVFLGTDAAERWEGKAFKDFAKPHFDKGQGWTYISRERHISFSEDRRTAWFDELLDHEKYGECRGSGVMLWKAGSEPSQGSWTIVQYNLSFPIPNDLAAEFTGRIKASQSKSKP